jgi:hypothetical protein
MIQVKLSDGARKELNEYRAQASSCFIIYYFAKF